MAKKKKPSFVCSACGHTVARWQGKCPACNEWNTFEEAVISGNDRPGTKSLSQVKKVKPVLITDVDMSGGEVRLKTGIHELDRVLGGGLVTGSLSLIGGDPGVGKSTLLLMALSQFAGKGLKTLYVSGEESARQIRLRAERLEINTAGLHLLAETDLDAALAAAELLKPRVVVLDSVQTLYSLSIDSVPGSMSQVREVANRSMQFSKRSGIPTFLVGHVTKQGSIAGPKVLEHLVDTVIYFEGEGASQLRALRAVKNRFGSTGELGFFEMTERGLEEVPDASARLLSERVQGAAGTTVLAAMEGSRTVLAEVQALVGQPTPATPSRTVLGMDRARLQMLLAVLAKMGYKLYDRDVFLSAAGGLRILEPAGDLAIAAAIASSVRDEAIHHRTLLFGEIGLVGEIRAVSHPAQRMLEAQRHGFTRVIGPHSIVQHAPEGLEAVGARTLRQALGQLFLGG
ncbi:MAG: DNA repair protein RadA [Proteobacteria bacterium]|nr:DNA repair protein RadA [Pseudomonadota bacterium]